jgi:hypothetical protein
MSTGARAEVIKERLGKQPTSASFFKPWHLTAQPQLSFYDRLRLLFGARLFVRFHSPDGECHAACSISAGIYPDWPENDNSTLNGWPK